MSAKLSNDQCLTCRFARWSTTGAGKLHPSGSGKCAYVVPEPALPASMYWLSHRPGTPSGGVINRREPLESQCPTFEVLP